MSAFINPSSWHSAGNIVNENKERADRAEQCAAYEADRADKAEALLTELQRDARRYRWLRDPANAQHPAWDVISSTESTAEQIDAAIDAAILEMTR